MHSAAGEFSGFPSGALEVGNKTQGREVCWWGGGCEGGGGHEAHGAGEGVCQC